jgi:signal transduction histidine kinase
MREGARPEVAAALAAAAAHDVRNLLAVVESSALLASQSLDDRAFAEKHLGRIRDKVRQAQDLLGRCLSVAKGDPIDKRSARLEDVVRVALETVTIPVGVAVELTPALTAAEVPCDALLLGRAVANLVDNAARAVADHGGGRVSVDASVEGADRVIAVRDTGPGLPPELALSGKTTKADGSGLGMLVAQAVLVAHGGSLLLASAEGWSTSIELRLPA